MNKIVKISIKVILFLEIFAVILFFLTNLFTPKWLGSEWKSPKTNVSFYKLEKDSLEVAFLGSSVVAAAFDPYQLYEDYGIASYNLGVMQQTMAGTYFWLKELMNYQSPKVVIVEVRTAGRISDKSESGSRKSYDYMAWGINKLQFAYEYYKSEDVDIFSYLFPMALYHTRWSELEEEDYKFVSGDNETDTRGFALLTTESHIDYSGFNENESFSKSKKYNGTNEAYLKRIIEYCQENNIELILTKTADPDWNAQKYNHVKKIADAYKVKYIDYNVNSVLEKADINIYNDAADNIHLNIYGGEKSTDYIGKYLKANYDLTDYRLEDCSISESFEEGKSKYELALKKAEEELQEYTGQYNQSMCAQ